MNKMLKSYKAIAMIVIACVFLVITVTIKNGGVKFDPVVYMKGRLDSTYHGVYDTEFLSMCDTSSVTIESNYEKGIDSAMQPVIETLQLENLTQDLKPQLRNLQKKILDKANYTVVSAEKQSDGSFSVKITVRPFDMIQQIDDAAPKFEEDFIKQFEDINVEAMSEEEYNIWYSNEAALAYAIGIIELMETAIEEADYKQEQEIVMQLEKNQNGLYDLSIEEFNKLDSIIMSGGIQ